MNLCENVVLTKNIIFQDTLEKKKQQLCTKIHQYRYIALKVTLFQKLAKIFSSGLCAVSAIFSESGRNRVKIFDAPVCQVPHFENHSSKTVRTTLRDDTVY